MTEEFPKPQRYNPPVSQLLTIGDARKMRQWPNYPQTYGLTQAHVPDLVRMIQDEELHWAYSDTREVWAPIHAWRALGQLRAETAVSAIIDTFPMIDDEDATDWQQSEYPRVLAMIGPAAIAPLQAYLADPRHGLWSRITAVDAFEKIGKQHPDTQEEIVAILTEQLKRYGRQDPILNSFIISALSEFKAIEAKEIMAAAFKAGRVDLSVEGDWEEVQIKMGLLKERITPVPEYGWISPELLPLAKKIRKSELSANLWKDVGRNDPCPCGSGKKFKKCHGKPGAQRVS